MRRIILIFTAIAGLLGWVYNNPRSPILHCLFNSTTGLNCSTGETATFTRASTSICGSAGSYTELASGEPCYTASGIRGFPSTAEQLANNFFSEATGNDFDDWTETVAGTSTVVADADAGRDSALTAQAVKITIDALDSDASISQSKVLSATTQYTLRIDHKEESGCTAAYYIITSDANKYLQEDGTWAVGSNIFTVSSPTRATVTRTFTSDTATTYTLYIQPSSAACTSKSFWVYHTSIYTGISPKAPCKTTTVAATCAIELTSIPVAGNVLAASGRILMTYTPASGYDHASNKLIFRSSGNFYLYYDSTVDKFYFCITDGGGEQCAISAVQSFAANIAIEISAEWAPGELVRLCVDATCVTSASGLVGAPSLAAAFSIGNNAGAGVSNGYIPHVIIGRRP